MRSERGWASSAAWVLGLLAVWLLATAGLRPLLLPDEGRYAEVAREMLAGDGLVPLLNGLPFFHKPPLTYWVDLLGLRLFGITPFAVRLGPALGAWLMGAALWLWLRRQQGPRAAGTALLVLATTPFWFIGGQYANHDMLVAGTLTVAVLALARALEARLAGRDADATAGPAAERASARADVRDHARAAQRTTAQRWLLVGWAACGLAVLAKGLIGVVLPALVLGPWLLAQRRWRDVAWLLHPAGLAVFAVVALPWFALMQHRDPGFFDYFIVEQHFRRFATASFNNRQPGWFFIAVLPLLTLPWAAWAPAALRQLWRACMPPPAGTAGPASAAGPAAAGPVDAAARRHALLMAWWVAAILLFFSLPASKLVGYIMPALAPWCALLAAPLAGLTTGLRTRPTADLPIHPRRGLPPLGRVALALAALLCLGSVVTLAWQAPKSSRDLGLALRAQAAPGDRVVLVDNPFYDVAFYARLAQPAQVASRWDDPEIARQDNWRKELADAARFDPARAAQQLYPITALPALVCGGQRVWLVAGHDQAARLAGVPGATLVLQGRHAQLWRAEPRTCPGGG